ncbi:hypothetical protein [Streptomyces sp. NPDC047028]|uniref:hypothetical protein n=1 Tax=Streptomyces sp. NPDC047028 TaxID=3155793 RepID=UPI0033C44045
MGGKPSRLDEYIGGCRQATDEVRSLLVRDCTSAEINRAATKAQLSVESLGEEIEKMRGGISRKEYEKWKRVLETFDEVLGSARQAEKSARSREEKRQLRLDQDMAKALQRRIEVARDPAERDDQSRELSVQCRRMMNALLDRTNELPEKEPGEYRSIRSLQQAADELRSEAGKLEPEAFIQRVSALKERIARHRSGIFEEKKISRAAPIWYEVEDPGDSAGPAVKTAYQSLIFYAPKQLEKAWARQNGRPATGERRKAETVARVKAIVDGWNKADFGDAIKRKVEEVVDSAIAAGYDVTAEDLRNALATIASNLVGLSYTTTLSAAPGGVGQYNTPSDKDVDKYK